jgi:hypothetical protein
MVEDDVSLSHRLAVDDDVANDLAAEYAGIRFRHRLGMDIRALSFGTRGRRKRKRKHRKHHGE